ncbi:MAG: 4-alpha-glucanotransferase [Opitutales bacterium]|nr:4-alpha-glucanotransferase [Opitutales bacterium]
MHAPLFNWLNSRGAGVLMHPSSLPGNQGIGTLDKTLVRFIDLLKQAGMSYWQTLPFGPTGYGDCPYSSFSSRAGNPYLIDMEAMVECGLLKGEDLDEISRLGSREVDFGRLYLIKWPLLKLAFKRFKQGACDELGDYGSFSAFKEDNKSWLEPFALFMALKINHAGRPWYEWEPKLRCWEKAAKARLTPDVKEEVEAQRFYQYLFFAQWAKIRNLAAKAGISIIGDLPFYVSRDSADVWSNPECFDLDADLNPNAVAGVPPDYFSPDGQLWGNPLYNWSKIKADSYSWWLDRLAANFGIFDIVRLDHFRAFHNYWKVPADAQTAKNGEWVLGPGMDFFKVVAKRFPNCRIIAEDLGDIDDGVHKLLKDTGLPGMAVLQFAFDGNPHNLHVSHNQKANQVLYPGTHDNDTTRGWYDKLPEVYRDQIRRYLRVSGKDIAWDFIREAYHSVPSLCISSAQDILGLGTDARMNEPGTSMGNWKWRMTQVQFEQLFVHAAALKELAGLYGRLPEKE